jgi:hypothetical protein
VLSSTRMPRWTHRGWLKHYLIVHSWSEVWYHPTHRHTKLLSLEIPYVPYVSVHFKCLFIRTQPTQSWMDIGGGYDLGVPNLWSRPLSTFPSTILHFPLIAHLVSNYANHSIILLNHIWPPSIERALSRVDFNNLSSTDSLHD